MNRYVVLVVVLFSGFGLSVVAAQQPDPQPPASYVNVSTILPLPDFIPTVGALYIDPANAPVGPYLSYGNDGKLVEVVYMVPLKEMEAATNWEDLSASVLGELSITSIDHVDVTYNGGHPGMAEPHYHVRLALVDESAQQSALAQ